MSPLVTSLILAATLSHAKPHHMDSVQSIDFTADVTEATADAFDKAFETALGRNPHHIVVEINSPGGLVSAGFTMARTIERSPVPVFCVVDGEADSMALYILESCHKRFMTKRSIIMCHESSIHTSTGGNEWFFRDLANELHASNVAMAEHIATRIHTTPEDLLKRIHNTALWMAWEEALDSGFVDGIVDSVDEIKTLAEHSVSAPTKR